MISSNLRRACGQLLSVGFDGPTAPAELVGRIARSEVGGVMLFRSNIESPAQVAALVASLRKTLSAVVEVLSRARAAAKGRLAHQRCRVEI